MSTLIEFYDGDATHPFASTKGEAVPRAGEYINIRKGTWLVQRVTWALDQPTGEQATLRANVELQRAR